MHNNSVNHMLYSVNHMLYSVNHLLYSVNHMLYSVANCTHCVNVNIIYIYMDFVFRVNFAESASSEYAV